MRDGCIPPTLNLHNPSPAGAGMDLTPLAARRRWVTTSLINAFGFGGQNAALIFRKWSS